MGVIQSFSDAVKLFIKEQFLPVKSNFSLYFLSPCFSLFIILFLWRRFPKLDMLRGIIFSRLFFFCCTRFGVYPLIRRGWSSNSNYALIGAMRGVAQTVSYEVRLALILIILIFTVKNYSFSSISQDQLNMIFLTLIWPMFLFWFISTLAETNRTPFDFAEGESELVSGFNIEYGRGGFALIFLAEYARIIFISYVLVLIFLGSFLSIGLLGHLLSIFFIFSIIWVRACYPRFRYDKLILLAWKLFLPCVLILIPYFINFYLLY